MSVVAKEKIRCRGDNYWCVPSSEKIVFTHRKSDLPKGAYPVRVARWWQHPDKVFSWGWSNAIEYAPNTLNEITLVSASD